MTNLISLLKDNLVDFDKSGGNPNSEMGWAICWRPFIDFDKFWGNPNNVHWDEQGCLLVISSRQGLFIGCQLLESVTNSNKLGEKWSRHLPSGPRRTVVVFFLSKISFQSFSVCWNKHKHSPVKLTQFRVQFWLRAQHKDKHQKGISRMSR